MRYKIAKICAYTPFVLYALEFVIKSFEFGVFVWLALIVLSIGGVRRTTNAAFYRKSCFSLSCILSLWASGSFSCKYAFMRLERAFMRSRKTSSMSRKLSLRLRKPSLRSRKASLMLRKTSLTLRKLSLMLRKTSLTLRKLSLRSRKLSLRYGIEIWYAKHIGFRKFYA